MTRAKRKPQPVAQAESLKSYFDRANNVLDELDGHKLDLSQVYKDAKDAGYDPKILRKIVTEKRRDQTDLAEEQALIEAYRHALSEPVKKAIAMVSAGSTLDEASKATGAPRSTVARLTPRASVPKTHDLGTPAHNSDTGELISEEGGAPNPVRDGGAPAETSADGPVVATITESCGGELKGPDTKPGALATSPKPEVAPGPQDLDLTIPAFLRRAPVPA